MKIKLIILAAVVGLQSAWILGTTAVQEQSLAHGKVVLLDTRPVDPRDLLRGDYVILEYTINSIPWSKFSPALTNDLPNGETVYVLLEQQGAFYQVTQASTEPIAGDQDHPVLRGLSAYSWRTRTNSTRVEYGLERYYVPEGTGNPTGKLTAEVAIPASGHGIIKQVYINGRPYRAAMREKQTR